VTRAYVVLVQETVDTEYGDEGFVVAGVVEAPSRPRARREARRQLAIPEGTMVALVPGGLRVEPIRE
jgi:hypothetical protein